MKEDIRLDLYLQLGFKPSNELILDIVKINQRIEELELIAKTSKDSNERIWDSILNTEDRSQFTPIGLTSRKRIAGDVANWCHNEELQAINTIEIMRSKKAHIIRMEFENKKYK